MTVAEEITEGFKITEVGELPYDWVVTTISSLNKEDKESINPMQYPSEIFEYYSIPAYQENKTPMLTKGIEILSQKLLLKSGTVLFGKLNPRVEKVWIVKSESSHRKIGSTEWLPILPNKNVADSDFIYYLSWSDYVMPLSKTLVAGSTPSRQRVDPQSFYKIKVPLPPLPEQQNIASVLSTIQEAKEKTDNVIQATKELKKSMMKHLFTYGPVPVEDAEKVPLKETEIGMIPETWDLECLGNLVDIKGGKRLLKGHFFAVDVTPFPYIRIVDFAKSSVKLSDLKYLTQMDRETIKRYIIKKEDIYISIAGTIGLVGTVPKELDGANLTENAARLILRDSKKIDKIYLVDFLASECGQNEIHKRATKTSQPKLALTRIKEIPVAIPSLPEQQQIADILSAINKKIVCEESKRNSLEALFKTLLSLLMTGKLRVKDLEISV